LMAPTQLCKRVCVREMERQSVWDRVLVRFCPGVEEVPHPYQPLYKSEWIAPL